MKYSLNESMLAFRDFLNASWDVVVPLLKDRDYACFENSIPDWLQLNWEELVERRVLGAGGYLVSYGDGADFYGKSDRMTNIDASTDLPVKIVGKVEKVMDVLNNEDVSSDQLEFDKFVTMYQGFHKEQPPFDYVLATDKISRKERVISIEQVTFELGEK